MPRFVSLLKSAANLSAASRVTANWPTPNAGFGVRAKEPQRA
jgi:hypothetical protein